MVRYILSNTLGPVIVAATLAVGAAILAESGWGRMRFDAQNAIEFAPWLAIFPDYVFFLRC